jgi:uncharacterized protein YyaL (SSP411 family)
VPLVPWSTSRSSDAIAATLNGTSVDQSGPRGASDIDRVHDVRAGDDRSGGWPMSVWLTPDLKPFWRRFPVVKWGRPLDSSTSCRKSRTWRADRDKVTMSADSLTDKLRSVERTASANVPDVAALERP